MDEFLKEICGKMSSNVKKSLGKRQIVKFMFDSYTAYQSIGSVCIKQHTFCLLKLLRAKHSKLTSEFSSWH